MSEGIVSETIFNCPFPRDRSAIVTQLGTSPIAPFRANSVRFPTYITTFRSGPSYLRSIRNGAVPHLSSLYETYAAMLGDTGHEFSLDKTELFSSRVTATGSSFPAGANKPLVGKNAVYFFRRNTGVSPAPSVFDPLTFNFRTTDNDLRGMGSSFLADTQPLKSEGDLLVSIAEMIREGFPRALSLTILNPSLKKGRKQRISAAGGEYLNYVFGYAPIVSDIVTVYDTFSRIDDLVEQWIRDNGKSVRRRRRVTLPREVTVLDYANTATNGVSSVSYLPPPNSTLPFDGLASVGNPAQTQTYSRQGQIIIEEDISFSSSFTYDLSKLSLKGLFTSDESISNQNVGLRQYLGLHALGLSPTDLSINTFWNLIPFSWLVDWFTNIGDVFDNFRASQSAGLQTNYAYITSTAYRKLFMSDSLVKGGGGYSISSVVNARQKSVRRLKATPYGFDVKFDSLTGSQAGILAALASSFAKI